MTGDSEQQVSLYNSDIVNSLFFSSLFCVISICFTNAKQGVANTVCMISVSIRFLW